MAVTEVKTVDGFKELIKENPKVVALFYATWCGACQKMAPIYENMSLKYNAIKFLNIDCDKNVEISKDIQAMPTFKFYHNGNLYDDKVGANEDKVEAKLEALNEK